MRYIILPLPSHHFPRFSRRVTQSHNRSRRPHTPRHVTSETSTPTCLIRPLSLPRAALVCPCQLPSSSHLFSHISYIPPLLPHSSSSPSPLSLSHLFHPSRSSSFGSKKITIWPIHTKKETIDGPVTVSPSVHLSVFDRNPSQSNPIHLSKTQNQGNLPLWTEFS